MVEGRGWTIEDIGWRVEDERERQIGQRRKERSCNISDRQDPNEFSPSCCWRRYQSSLILNIIEGSLSSIKRFSLYPKNTLSYMTESRG